ncbi:hypothetical protein R3P38DRAFT_715055 [Favolaschia claudopus]|uniref:Uncharacterized protein n=1 Tax=Favolaschia claudopus TaxID=2862362 RepID=A0AAV9Z5F0_9AGAR
MAPTVEVRQIPPQAGAVDVADFYPALLHTCAMSFGFDSQNPARTPLPANQSPPSTPVARRAVSSRVRASSQNARTVQGGCQCNQRARVGEASMSSRQRTSYRYPIMRLPSSRHLLPAARPPSRIILSTRVLRASSPCPSPVPLPVPVPVPTASAYHQHAGISYPLSRLPPLDSIHSPFASARHTSRPPLAGGYVCCGRTPLSSQFAARLLAVCVGCPSLTTWRR